MPVIDEDFFLVTIDDDILDRPPTVQIAQPLNYSLLSSFTRAGEAAFIDPRTPWGFQGGTEALNYLADDVSRVFSDGGILMEEGRTNFMAESWFNTWAAEVGASFLIDNAASPDANISGKSAATVTFSANALSRLRNTTGIVVGAGSDNTDAIVSCWLRSTSGTESARIGLRSKDGSAFLLSTDITVTTTFVRHTFYVADIGAGATQPHGLLVNGTDAAARTIEAWGFQVEHLFEHITSPIRTDGATVTRGSETARFNAGLWEFVRRNDWQVDVYPEWSTLEAPVGGEEHVVYNGNLTADRLTFRFTGSLWFCDYFEFGPPATSSNIALIGAGKTFGPGDKVTIFVTRSLNKIQLSVNDGTVFDGSSPVNALVDWSTSTGELFVGLGNNFIFHFNGVIMPPSRP